MECPNCAFQCIPGSRACVRCGTRLDLADVPVDPPRAPGGVIARAVSNQVAATRWSLQVRRARHAHRLRWLTGVSIPWRALSWSIGPGLGQVAIGRAALGAGILGAWGVLVFLSVFLLGRPLGVICAMGAMSLHGSASAALVAHHLREWTLGQRVLFGVGLYAALVCVVYAPVISLGSRLVRPVSLYAQGVRENPVIALGDVLLSTGPWTTPEIRRGDIVRARMLPMRFSGVIVGEGEFIDRVVGLPGEHVEGTGRSFTIDGKPLDESMLPLRPSWPGRIDIQLGSDEYFVLPSVVRALYHNETTDEINAMTSASRVARKDISGVIFWRLTPWSRFGRIPGGPAGE